MVSEPVAPWKSFRCWSTSRNAERVVGAFFSMMLRTIAPESKPTASSKVIDASLYWSRNAATKAFVDGRSLVS